MQHVRESLRFLSILFLALSSLSQPASAARTAQDQPNLEWYLPEGVSYDADFPTPDQVLGWQVGSWHVRHDQLVQWFRRVAQDSPRVQLETYGFTHEQRPLLLATISSPRNLVHIDEIREAHRKSVLEGDESYAGPSVVWMGYSVHGNESSGANAALLLAYHLAAANGQEMEDFLEQTVVLIDPCVNPDGLNRFAHWANTHRGKNLVGDPNHREHREVWPGGRTNHYWFDLNRDWLLLTHPESQGRLAKFHEWLPCVLTDYHEMGSDSTYFFQPGIPSRQNPLTPERNLELTRGIAKFHAAALDELGSLYYTEESFDDFYYGKGSTYPDINGCIGILFEQASSRGHLQENSFGGISFPFTIRNQFVTSLSTLKASQRMRNELTSYQREFFSTALEEAGEQPLYGYVFGASEDPERTFRMADILRRHNIRIHHLGADTSFEESDTEAAIAFPAASSFIIPLEQPQFRLIRALFETRTSWPDNTFYDVSSWTMPLSFDVPARALTRTSPDEDAPLGPEWNPTAAPQGTLAAAQNPVAYLFEWHHYNAPRALHSLLKAGVRARVATRLFRAETSDGPRDFDYGTIVVPTGIQEVDEARLRELMAAVAADGLNVFAATSGLTPAGVDLGSGRLRPLEEPKPLLLIGRGVSSYEAGEAWHYLDQRVDMAVSMVEASSFGRLDLSRYTHILLVSGGSSGLSDDDEARLKRWLRAGGVLVATKSSATWAAEKLLSKADEKKADKDKADKQEPQEEGADEEADAEAIAEKPAPPSYADYEDLRAVQRVAGTIFKVSLDLSHPLCFGYGRDTLTVFRNSGSILAEGNDPFAAPLRYVESPLVSGYCSKENVEKISGSPAGRVERVGSGTVICLIDNPNFRGVWYGTNKLYANAIFFGNAVKRTGPVEPRSAGSDAEDSHGHSHGE